MPRDIVSKLNATLGAGLKSPEVLQRMQTLGYEPIGGTPEQFSATIKADLVKYSNVIKSAGIKIEN